MAQGSAGWRWSPVAWVAAVVVLAAVGGAVLPSLVTPTAQAVTLARVVVQPAAPGRPTDPADAVATVVGLSETRVVRDAVAARAGVAPETVAASLRVAPGTRAGFVDVRGVASGPDEAERTAVAAVEELAVALERADSEGLRVVLGPLSTELARLGDQLRTMDAGDPARGAVAQRYGALATEITARTASPAPRLLPSGPPAVTSEARPARTVTAAVAALAAFVLAVPVALLAARRRRPSGTDDTHGLVAPVPGARAFLVWTDDAPAVLTRFWVGAVRGQGPVLVLQLSDADRLDLAGELAAAGRLVGDAVTHRDLTPGATPPAPISGRSLVVSALRTPVVDGAAVAALRAAAPAVVLAVDTAHTGRRDVDVALDVVRGLGLSVRGVVVWRGRLPRDPAREPVGPSGDAEEG